MKHIKKLLTCTVFSTLTLAPMTSIAEVIEVVTFTLKQGVSYEAFALLDKAVEEQHVSKQPGFISRESARGIEGEWLVLVRWKTPIDADASMNSFMDAPAASEFINHIDGTTMRMRRYTK